MSVNNCYYILYYYYAIIDISYIVRITGCPKLQKNTGNSKSSFILDMTYIFLFYVRLPAFLLRYYHIECIMMYEVLYVLSYYIIHSSMNRDHNNDTNRKLWSIIRRLIGKYSAGGVVIIKYKMTIFEYRKWSSLEY